MGLARPARSPAAGELGPLRLSHDVTLRACKACVHLARPQSHIGRYMFEPKRWEGPSEGAVCMYVFIQSPATSVLRAVLNSSLLCSDHERRKQGTTPSSLGCPAGVLALCFATLPPGPTVLPVLRLWDQATVQHLQVSPYAMHHAALIFSSVSVCACISMLCTSPCRCVHICCAHRDIYFCRRAFQCLREVTGVVRTAMPSSPWAGMPQDFHSKALQVGSAIDCPVAVYIR